MTRNDLKYFVTALLFVDLCSVAVLGLLMAFVIPSGNVAMQAKVFLGLHRSKWADIHVTLALILLGLIAWHFLIADFATRKAAICTCIPGPSGRRGAISRRWSTLLAYLNKQFHFLEKEIG